MDLGFDISEWGFLQPPESRVQLRRPIKGASAEDELRAKQLRAKTAIPGSAPFQPFFGVTLVSCERGELRQSPRGLLVSTSEGRSEVELPTDRTPRDLVVAEFHDAITGAAPALHDGRWGRANLEICALAIASSASGREQTPQLQVAVPPSQHR
jgi:phthalate 4,5-cis-dihydrodiol dehydrogenase